MHSEEQTKQREYTEVTVKLPWGHISGKWWGPQVGRPILALHGWQDNAGTFDTLIPLLPPQIGILAIDLPGHGRSSWFPNGLMYHISDLVNVILMIMKEYSWEKVSILAHSLGSIVAFQLAGIFPEKVDLIIGMDTYKPTRHIEDNFTVTIERIIASFLIFDDRNRNSNEPPSYSYEKCIEKVFIGSGKSVDRGKCAYLVERNVRKSAKLPDKLYFAQDSRVKAMNPGVWPDKQICDLLAHISCPVLFIKASDTKYFDESAFEEHLKILRKNPRFEFHGVLGTHHVHLNEPQKVSGIISQFLMKHLTTTAKL